MQQFQEIIPINSRIKLHQIFNNKKQNNQLDFVPYFHQRDKLGRLISGEVKKRSQSIELIKQKLTNHLSNPQQYLNKHKSTDNTVQKIFKIKSIRELSSSKLKQKILIKFNNKQRNITPNIGYYDSAPIQVKIKFNKQKSIFIKHKSIQTIKKQQVNKQLINQKIHSFKIKQKPIIIPQKLTINYNLPQLQRYHERKRLNMNIVNNFQQDHQKFKKIARFSLVLANSIKRQLDIE